MMRAIDPAAPAGPPQKPSLSDADVRRLERIGGRWPRVLVRSRKRRRLLLLGLAAPGFALVFSTPAHQNLALSVLGLLLFAAALVFRARTEGVFARAEAARLWPPAPIARPSHQESPHA